MNAPWTYFFSPAARIAASSRRTPPPATRRSGRGSAGPRPRPALPPSQGRSARTGPTARRRSGPRSGTAPARRGHAGRPTGRRPSPTGAARRTAARPAPRPGGPRRGSPRTRTGPTAGRAGSGPQGVARGRLAAGRNGRSRRLRPGQRRNAQEPCGKWPTAPPNASPRPATQAASPVSASSAPARPRAAPSGRAACAPAGQPLSRHRGVPRVPRCAPQSRVQLLPQLRDQLRQRRDLPGLPGDQRITRLRRRQRLGHVMIPRNRRRAPPSRHPARSATVISEPVTYRNIKTPISRGRECLPSMG